MSKDFPVDFVLIFALEKEIQAFLKYVGEYEKRESHGTWYKFKIANPELGIKYEVCAISLKEMGNYEAAAATTRAIDVWNPKYVIIGGIAGGAKQEGFKLGDLVVAEDVIAYEPGKEHNSRVDRRFRILRSSQELLELAKALPSSQWATDIKVPRPRDPDARLVPKVHYGSVSCSPTFGQFPA